MAGSGTGDVSPAKKIKCGAGAIVIPQLPKEKIRLLREAILALDDSVLFGYSLIKIIKSNAEMCCPFQKSFVKFERSCDKNQPEPERKIVYNFAGVFEKGVNILNQHLEDPGKVPEVKEMRLALLRLTRTILTIDGLYPGFLLCRGTHDSAPVCHQRKNVHYVLLFTYLVESSALILATKSRF